MKQNTPTFETVDEYITSFPDETQEVLNKIRSIIIKAAPEATEKMSYGILTYAYKRNLVHFGAFDGHYSLFPGSKGVEAFKDRLEGYKTSKGTIRFPSNEPIPYDLIEDITKHLVKSHNEA